MIRVTYVKIGIQMQLESANNMGVGQFSPYCHTFSFLCAKLENSKMVVQKKNPLN